MQKYDKRESVPQWKFAISMSTRRLTVNKSRETYICSALFVIAAIFILAAQPYVSSFYGSKPSFWLHIISYCAMAVTAVLGIKEVDILACVLLVITAVLSVVICVARGSGMMGVVIVFFDAGALLLLASSVYSKMKYLSYAAAAVVVLGLAVRAFFGAIFAYVMSGVEVIKCLLLLAALILNGVRYPKAKDKKGMDDPLEKVEGLKSLLDKGIITQTEFEKKKEKILELKNR